MMEKSANKYLPSTCYVCQKCLRYFKLLEDSCECQKDSKLSRVKNPLHGQQIYQRAFTPGHNFPILNRFLLDVDTKFGYNSNFKENFSYTTCSTCNSKLQRLKENDKKSKHKEIQKLKSSKSSNRKVQDNEVIVLDNLPNESNKKRARDHSTNRERNRKDNGNKVIEVEVKDGNNNGKDDDDDKDENDDYKDNDGDDNKDEDEGDDRNFDDDDDENYEEDEDYNRMEDYDNSEYCNEDDIIDKMKIQLVVKDKDIKTPTAKILVIQPVSYKNVIEEINLATKKILGKKFRSKDYIISYKVMNARGPSNTLEDKLDFQEFISEYQKVISSGKKMLVMVTVKDNVNERKNRKYKMVKFFIYIIIK